MIQLQNLTLRRGNKTLLENAALRLDTGKKAGLIGRNGAGKTSLFKCLLGQLSEDKGEVSIPAQWRIAHLAQELPESKLTAFEYVRAGDTDWVKIQEDIAQAEAADDGIALANHYAELEHIDGYSIDSRVATILQGLGFKTEDTHNPINYFSGGWQMRLQLARVLLSRADIMLLDEPTNHLDLETIFWLEQWLASYQGTLVIISHDRDFLDRVTDHTIHLSFQKLQLYSGNYTSFTRQFQEALLLQEKYNAKILKQKAHMQSFVDRFRAKASKAKQAQGRLKAIEKLHTSSALQEETGVQFDFFPSEQPGYPTLSIAGDLGYAATKILNAVNLVVGAGDRIGVIGVNGSGKSTLLKSISGKIPLLKGGIELHPKAKIGYFSQQSVDMLHWELTPLEHMLELAPQLSEKEARTYLGRFDFSHDRVFEQVKIFSGGEKARLALALLIWQKPNVLILDEPTNHLDMHVREALILALQDFAGALLLVSHDRYFLECCIDQLWLVQNHGVAVYSGNLDDYQQQASENSSRKNTEQKPAKQSGTKTKPITEIKTKTIALDHKKIKKLEREVERINKKISAIQQQLEDPELYQKQQHDKIKELQAEQTKWQKELEKIEEAWLQAMGES